jgi:predicted nucleic acid-binding protein
MSANCFIDSNVWLYLLSDDDKHKKTKAKAFLAGQPGDETFHKVISWQVMNEVCANLIRKKGRTKSLFPSPSTFSFVLA